MLTSKASIFPAITTRNWQEPEGFRMASVLQATA